MIYILYLHDRTFGAFHRDLFPTAPFLFASHNYDIVAQQKEIVWEKIEDINSKYKKYNEELNNFRNSFPKAPNKKWFNFYISNEDKLYKKQIEEWNFKYPIFKDYLSDKYNLHRQESTELISYEQLSIFEAISDLSIFM